MSKYESRTRRDAFANGKPGRIRRDARRAAIAAKRSWLDM